MTRRRGPPEEMSPREARDRYLRRRRTDATDSSVQSWRYRLKIFVEWCEGVGIERVGQLRRADLSEFHELRAAKVEPVTLEGEMHTLQSFLEFLSDEGAVAPDLSDAVHIPKLDSEQRSSDKKLHARDALPLLEWFRNTPVVYGTRQHALLELLWNTGARQGGIRALDVRDFHAPPDPYVEFRHRPETDTPLKNKIHGERPVELPEETGDAVAEYVAEYRVDTHDDHGRQPLITSNQGRPTGNTVRVWSYLATLPCQHTDCPHGKNPAACEWTEYSQASKCPSSRAPHHIRTGAITHLLNLGWPPEDVAERVNSAVKTIEQHYDKAAPDERFRRLKNRMEDRRRSLVNDLDPTNETNTTS